MVLFKSMKIDTKSEFPDGRKYEFSFTDEIDGSGICVDGVKAICFYNSELLIVKSSGGNWDHPGGGVEENENYIEGCKREIIEESNMEVVDHRIIGFQVVKNINKGTNYWLAFIACKVKPISDFVSDPDNDIVDIKIINPDEHERYLKYGELGEYLISKSKKLLNI